jgi:hypothetical protein
MTNDEQLSCWVAGQSIHTAECTPDFSCCKPVLLWPHHIRQRFVTGTDRERNVMLMFSLGRMLQYEEIRKVPIAGTGSDAVDGVTDFDDLLARLEKLKTICDGPCEGRGFFPCKRDHDNLEYRALWEAAQREAPADDLGYHFLTCPVCQGTGKTRPTTT